MGNRGRSFVAIILMVFVVLSGLASVSAESEITIQLNNRQIGFPDAKPYMDKAAGRVLVPVRFISEGLGAAVQWDQANRTVHILKEESYISLRLEEKSYTVNGVEKTMDTAAFLKDNRTFVPIRFISEGLGLDVNWNQQTSTVLLDEKDNQGFSVRGIAIGTSEKELIAKLGQPARRDLSKYGFQWYIYNQDYRNYVQVGVMNGTVVSLYSNTDHWHYKNSIKIGTSRKDVEKLLGESLKSIKKGNTIYHLYNTEEKGLYFIDGSYVSFYYDVHQGNTVTSIHIVREDMELGLNGFYGKYTESLKEGFERQIFDLANVVRVRNGLEPFQWSDKARDSARKHSRDMAYNNFFEHVNLKGEGPAARMEKEGINYRLAAENIAAGTSDAIEAHEGWMNSLGHRENILGKAKNLGVGVGYNASNQYQYFYTQNFFTEM